MNKTEFVTALVDKVSRSEFPDYVKQSAAEIAAQLREKIEVFVAGELVDEAPERGQSKVGGRPDVPAGFTWPYEEEGDESPLQFVAQINLAEVHEHDFDRKLPPKGMVWLFSIADGDRAYGHEIDASTTKVMFAAEANPAALEPHDIPEDLAENEDAQIEERRIVFGPTVSFGAFRDAGITRVIEQSLRELGGRRGPVFMLNEVDEADEPSFMLADFDMYKIARNAFGEGVLSFTLTAKQLAAGDLAAADTVFTSGS